MIEIVRAPAYLAVQDPGFSGMREMGLPRAGAMDPPSLALGNSLVGNSPGAPALEWALSGGTIRFARDVTVALTGAYAAGLIGNQAIESNTTYQVLQGQSIVIDRITAGRFLYLCVSPPLEVAKIFGSRSTYLPSALGGFEGRRLRNGDFLELSATGNVQQSAIPELPDYTSPVIRISRAPQSHVLNGRILDHLLHNGFAVSHSSDRTGYRLDGPTAPVEGLGQILSEPACEGAIQITDGGTPIVLMADGPTIGGYNKVAVVVEADLPILAQKAPGETIRFALR